MLGISYSKKNFSDVFSRLDATSGRDSMYGAIITMKIIIAYTHLYPAGGITCRGKIDRMLMALLMSMYSARRWPVGHYPVTI